MLHNRILALSMAFNQEPTSFILLPCDTEFSVVFYHFEGRALEEFQVFPGIWCFYNPAYDNSILCCGCARDISSVKIPPAVLRLATLLQYKLYVSIPPLPGEKDLPYDAEDEFDFMEFLTYQLTQWHISLLDLEL